MKQHLLFISMRKIDQSSWFLLLFSNYLIFIPRWNSHSTKNETLPISERVGAGESEKYEFSSCQIVRNVCIDWQVLQWIHQKYFKFQAIFWALPLFRHEKLRGEDERGRERDVQEMKQKFMNNFRFFIVINGLPPIAKVMFVTFQWFHNTTPLWAVTRSNPNQYYINNHTQH